MNFTLQYFSHLAVFFLYSLMDGIDPEDIKDEDELNMTAFGELFADPTKMKVSNVC